MLRVIVILVILAGEITIGLFIAVISALWLAFVITPLYSLKSYRRFRGGAWATVTGFMWGRRWVRLGPEAAYQAEENYSNKDQLNDSA